MPVPWTRDGANEDPRRLPERPALFRVALAVLALKAYTLVLLWAFAQRTPLRPRYDAFLFLGRHQDGCERIEARQDRCERLGALDGRRERLEAIEGSFLERLAPYDGQFYLDIAERRYRMFEEPRDGRVPSSQARGPPGNHAFFPLLPLLIRAARAAAGEREGLAIAILSNVFLSAAGAAGLYLLASRIGAPAWTSVLLLLTFPTAVFQCALYTESLLLFLSVAAALAAASGRDALGAGLGYLAGLTRPQGVLVSAFWAPGTGWPGPKGPRGFPPASPWGGWSAGRLLAFLAPAAGLATHAAVLWIQVGSPLAFLSIQSHWGREFSASSLLGQIIRPSSYAGPPFDRLAVALGVGLLPWLWLRLPRALALHGTLSVLVPLSTGTILSFGRFLSVSFPHFLALAMLLGGRRAAAALFVACSILLGALVARGLVGWHFVG